MNKIKPLTEAETDQLLVLLRKIWKEESGADQQCKRHAKGLFSRITTLQIDEPEKIEYICKRCGLEQIQGTREQTRDFVYTDICVGCMKKENT